MKTKNRILGILLTFCMLISTVGVLPMSVFAAGEAKIIPSAADMKTETVDGELSII